MKKKTVGYTIAIVVALLVVIVLGNTLYTVREDEYGVVKEFGKIQYVVSDAGLKVKTPFIQEVDFLPKELQLYDIPESDVITEDKKSMIVDCFVTWKITDPLLFAQSLNNSLTNAEGRIDMLVYNSIKNVISSMTQEEIIEARGNKLTTLLMENLTSPVTQYGIVISTVDVKLLDLPDDNKFAVYERMISEREQMAASYTAEGDKEATMIRNETDKQATLLLSEAEKEAAILEAEGEAEYMRIISEAYNDADKADFYVFLRSLDALKISLAGDDKTIILDKDSPLAQLFYAY